jgi:hypothetical protein
MSPIQGSLRRFTHNPSVCTSLRANGNRAANTAKSTRKLWAESHAWISLKLAACSDPVQAFLKESQQSPRMFGCLAPRRPNPRLACQRPGNSLQPSHYFALTQRAWRRPQEWLAALSATREMGTSKRVPKRRSRLVRMPTSFSALGDRHAGDRAPLVVPLDVRTHLSGNGPVKGAEFER